MVGVAHSKIYYADDAGMMNGFAPNGPAIEAVTDSLVMAATGQKSAAGAWRSLVAPGDHIGIKIAAAGGRIFRPISQLCGLYCAGWWRRGCRCLKW